MSEDWLNPSRPSSHVDGWSNFEDGTTKPNTVVHRWLAQWKDAHGNIVLYNFEYRDPIDYNRHQTEPDTTDLTVVAAYFPAKVAKQIMGTDTVGPKQDK